MLLLVPAAVSYLAAGLDVTELKEYVWRLKEDPMAQPVQNLKNHVRTIPGYHMFTFGLIVINALWSIYRAATDFSVDRLMTVFVAVALAMIFFYARVFSLTVQDRVIRLEMRLRLAQLLPADLKPRINELSADQLCALRFASDGELPELTRAVLANNIADRKTIKQMIKTWEADLLRA